VKTKQNKTKQKFANLNYPSTHALWTSAFTVYGDMTRWREHMMEDIKQTGKVWVHVRSIYRKIQKNEGFVIDKPTHPGGK
jgi:hypothetical protein